MNALLGKTLSFEDGLTATVFRFEHVGFTSFAMLVDDRGCFHMRDIGNCDYTY